MRPTRWKTIIGTTAAAGISVGAIAGASSNSSIDLNDVRQPIALEQVSDAAADAVDTTIPVVDPSPESLDSPFESLEESLDSPYDSPDDPADPSPESLDSPFESVEESLDSPFDSPDDAPAPAPAPTPAPPVDDSYDSPASYSYDSPESVDS